jgi:hypothetical protein
MYRFVSATVKIASAAISTIAGLSFMHPAVANLVGVDVSTGTLYSISETNASKTPIGNTGISGATGQWADIQFFNGTLYGFTISIPPNPPLPALLPTLYSINPTTAATTSIGLLNPPGTSSVFEGGLAFSPSGTAYGMNLRIITPTSVDLFTINPANGALTDLGAVKTTTGANANLDINGLAFRSDGKLIGLDDLSNSLVVIDPSTLRETTLITVPSTVGSVGGMTVDSGVGYYVTAGPGANTPGSDNLYRFDLFSGASILIGNLGFTDFGLSGLAAVPASAPEPPTWGILLTALAMFGFATRRSRRRDASA